MQIISPAGERLAIKNEQQKKKPRPAGVVREKMRSRKFARKPTFGVRNRDAAGKTLPAKDQSIPADEPIDTTAKEEEDDADKRSLDVLAKELRSGLDQYKRG